MPVLKTIEVSPVKFLTEAHVRAGWVGRDTRIEEFEAAIRAVCEPIFAKPIKDISFGRLLLRP